MRQSKRTRWPRWAWGLVRACHPEPTLAVTAVITALAVTTGRDAAGVAAVAAAVLAGQLATGWTNDHLDAARDAAVGRRDKPVATGTVPARTVGIAAVAAATACVPLSLLSGWRAGVLHLLAVAAAAGYNAGLKSTVLSPLPYAAAFGALPAFVVLGLPGSPTPPVWLVTAGALLGAAAHFANVLPDLDDDAATGVRGLPHRWGFWPAAGAAAMLLTGATAALGFGLPRPLAAAGLVAAAVVLTAGLVAGRRVGSRWPFRAVLVVAVIDVTLLLASGVRVG